MSAQTANNWDEANQGYLSTALSLVRNALEQYIARIQGTSEPETRACDLQVALEEAASTMLAPAALITLCATFGLTLFERDVLLLCMGLELDGSFASLCAMAHSFQGKEWKGTGPGYATASPTFSLALAALPHAHWDALAPSAPLRHWQLITIGSGLALTLSPLRVDERILHYLTGVEHLDERLVALVAPLSSSDTLVPSQRILAEQLAMAWPRTSSFFKTGEADQRLPVVQLCGEDIAAKQTIAVSACAARGWRVSRMLADVLPTSPAEIEALARLWERESALSRTVLFLDCDEADTTDSARTSAIVHMVQRIHSPLILSSRERRRLSPRLSSVVITLDVHKPEIGEQRVIWQSALGNRDLNGHLDTLTSQFNLGASAIYSASAQVLSTHEPMFHAPDEVSGEAHVEQDLLLSLLWDACRIQARQELNDLAQRIEPGASWDDLVLPDGQRQVLNEIVVHVRQRATVYEKWGFRTRGIRGLGISALFAGASGTGKTLAAEVLAHELRLDLYRIDLSSLVSKYIGETEKNLRHVFDAAEEGGAILLFDEADALFGKRSEVKDSHDRYANIEVSYLLQRMEAYRGLAILTTNLKSSLDTAFLRRIRFIVNFPFPDVMQRSEIWQRIFPCSLPTEGLDMSKLAKLNVAGGNIRNIALNAAFLAADAREPVRMTHLLRATRSEYAKLEKPLTEAEIGGWI